MSKTKLGVAVGLVGAAVYLGSLFGGYTVLILLAGYCLLFEENAWLKKTCVKAVVLVIMFSMLRTLLGLIPDVLYIVSDFLSLLTLNVHFSYLNNIFSFLINIVDLLKTVLFLYLGYVSVHEGTFAIPMVDKLISKYMD